MDFIANQETKLKAASKVKVSEKKVVEKEEKGTLLTESLANSNNWYSSLSNPLTNPLLQPVLAPLL